MAIREQWAPGGASGGGGGGTNNKHIQIQVTLW